MSWVGPRPALFNQLDLITLRTDLGVHTLVPGITGWAQINGRDEIDIPTKVQYDIEYLINQSIKLDIKIIILTIFKVLLRKNIKH
jgi:O-antigen biosynthesis protein WbqP